VIVEKVYRVVFNSNTITLTDKQRPFNLNETDTSQGFWHPVFPYLPLPVLLVMLTLIISIVVLLLEFKVKQYIPAMGEQEAT